MDEDFFMSLYLYVPTLSLPNDKRFLRKTCLESVSLAYITVFLFREKSMLLRTTFLAGGNDVLGRGDMIKQCTIFNMP